MDWSTLIRWDLGSIVLYTIISIILYMISNTQDLKDKVKHPKLLASAGALISCFEIGLFAFIPLILSLSLIYGLEYWIDKNGKRK